MSIRTLAKRPAFVVAVMALMVIGVVWCISAGRANGPKSLDQRLYDVTSQIQCPACNGESVANSSSQVAADMRSVAREKLLEGNSEAQVLQYFRNRYGDTILESPPKQGFTLLIWWAPVLMLIAGLVILWTVAREWRARASGDARRAATDERGGELFTSDERDALRSLLRRELDAEEGFATGRTLASGGEK